MAPLLNTTFPLCSDRIGSAYELPVLVDLNWLGRTMTSPNAGIVPSRSASSIIPADNSAIIL